MTTLSDIFTAFAPASLERYPPLPTAPPKVLSAIQHCRRGHSGYSRYQCSRCGNHHRVQHACGHRHCPQCQPHTTPPGLQHHLDKQLPGPHFLVTFTVPETLRPCLRSQQRLAYQALCNASSQALKRLAPEERFLGTHLPGFLGSLPPWGRQRQSHPHLHSMVPGGGLSVDRTIWRPSRATFYVPLKALSPLYRALFKAAMDQAGLRAQIDPLVWHTNWNGPSQANPNGPTSFTSLAPYVFKVAISNRRIVALTERPVTFTSRKVGSARPRTPPLTSWNFAAASSRMACPRAS